MIRDRLRESDYEIYPSDKPVTREVLDQWYLNDPDFGIVFRENGEIKGANITIPLNRRGWEGLIYGKLLESDCREQAFVNDEHILEKNGRIHIAEIKNQEELVNKLSEGYFYRNRCKMLVTCPGEPSLVWEYIRSG